VVVNPDKLDSMVYSEKYLSSVTPSSRGFGGKPLEGSVVVTGTGLVGALVTSGCDDFSKPNSASEKISSIRSNVQFADMAYAKGKMIYSLDMEALITPTSNNFLVFRWRNNSCRLQ